MARHKRPHTFSLQFDVPWQSKPLVKRRNRLVVDERLRAPTGEVEVPLALDQVEAAAQVFKKRGLKAVVICFLFSFLNNEHEVKARDIVKRVIPDAFVCCSHEVVNVIREYERFSSTAMNAYIGPTTARYLERLEGRLRENGVTAKVRIMQSNGGISTVENSSRRPVGLLLSGPAGGVIGGRWTGASCNTKNVITIDVGGTSADISVIQNGELRIKNPRDTEVAHLPVLVPMIDVDAIGAGGGSIAYLDPGGAFRVGPRSAGADPGPACYGKGGDQPTVTDANVVLGRLPPQLLGGKMLLDTKAAEEAVGKIARALSLDLHQAAQGILDIVNENMFGALRLVTVQKGLDPRDFALVAFGGAGPLHGNAMGILAGCYPTIVPPTPGVLSALGFLYSDVKNEFAQTFVRNIDDADIGQVGDILSRLGRDARAWLRDEGIDESRQQMSYEADVRYFRQGYEFSLEIDPERLGGGALQDLATRFSLAHERIYGFKLDQPVEFVNLRAVGVGAVEKIKLPKFEKEGPDAKAAVVEQHRAYFDGSFSSVNVYDRTRLRAGNRIRGPAIVTQMDATTVVHPAHTAEVDEYLNILITPDKAS